MGAMSTSTSIEWRSGNMRSSSPLVCFPSIAQQVRVEPLLSPEVSWKDHVSNSSTFCRALLDAKPTLACYLIYHVLLVDIRFGKERSSAIPARVGSKQESCSGSARQRLHTEPSPSRTTIGFQAAVQPRRDRPTLAQPPESGGGHVPEWFCDNGNSIAWA